MPDANARLHQLRQWSATNHGLASDAVNLELAAGDASFRRYYRLTLADASTRMLMDAPPAQEDSGPFVAIAKQWALAGLPVPQIHSMDLDAGFIELDDLGDTPMQCRLDGHSGEATLAWFTRAIDAIHELQNRANPEPLPNYDATLFNTELALFPEWCLSRWLSLPTPDSWPALRDSLVNTALQQPIVTVHRDFDAMNLMVHGDTLYLIDFQDAVAGPISYDLISLLHGRYCRFSRERRLSWQASFHARAQADGRLSQQLSVDDFHRQVAAMAAQRSLKVLGIFCRLTLRDHRHGYLARLPHFLDHLSDALHDLSISATGKAEHSLTAFQGWLENTLRPALLARVATDTEPHP
ncbi:aminoglycoside phosphotransferase family protein [Halomonas halocynthiae]|uniref:aminoglycoside phosphotransferase family protein n=1 Tax=Halomonas halocynthiae TaxID=176290 RepID=UPI00040CFDBE|nr:phosphotransferase [Halomonas halocynthiae]